MISMTSSTLIAPEQLTLSLTTPQTNKIFQIFKQLGHFEVRQGQAAFESRHITFR